MKENYIPLLISAIFTFLFVLKYGFDIGYIVGALSVGIISSAILEIKNHKKSKE